jgi:hypothetical protein
VRETGRERERESVRVSEKEKARARERVCAFERESESESDSVSVCKSLGVCETRRASGRVCVRESVLDTESVPPGLAHTLTDWAGELQRNGSRRAAPLAAPPRKRECECECEGE